MDFLMKLSLLAPRTYMHCCVQLTLCGERLSLMVPQLASYCPPTVEEQRGAAVGGMKAAVDALVGDLSLTGPDS